GGGCTRRQLPNRRRVKRPGIYSPRSARSLVESCRRADAGRARQAGKAPLRHVGRDARQRRSRAVSEGTHIFLHKSHGLFYVAPNQDAFMLRLRLPGGIVSSNQARGLCSLAERFGGGYLHVATRG